MKEVPITGEVSALAQELHRRRLAAGSGVAPSYPTAIAEVAVLSIYDRTPAMKDFTVRPKSLQMTPEDEAGNRIRIIQGQSWPIRVYSNRLDVNAFVFAATDLRTKVVKVAGWLPRTFVEEAPIYWHEEDGERVDYAHEVDRSHIFDLPVMFDFTDPCTHEWGGVWDYRLEAWECFGCGNYLYNQQDRELIERQDLRLRSERNPDAPGTT